MIAYFETSALIKLLVDEDGSDAARAVWDAADRLATSRLAYPEARAALAASVRLRRLSRGSHGRAKELLTARWEALDIVEVTEAIARAAGDHAEAYRLRGYDAVHLASALALPDPVLVTWDRDLLRAAGVRGLAIAGGPA